MKSFTAVVLGVCFLATIHRGATYDFIDYIGSTDSDGGGAISTNVNDQCFDVNGKPIKTESIVDVSGCFVLYADKECSGASEEVNDVQKTYEILQFSSYKTVACPEGK